MGTLPLEDRDTSWRTAWEWGLYAGGGALAGLCGLSIGNLYLGIPFHINPAQGVTYTGGWVTLLSPFALLCGAVSVTMMVLVGASYAAMKRGEAMVRRRAAHTGISSAGLFVIAFVAAGIMVIYWLDGYRLLGADTSPQVPDIVGKVVCVSPGAWLDNYIKWHWLWMAPLAALMGALAACWLLLMRWTHAAFAASCLVPAGTVLTAGFALYPFLMPSSENPNHSLTVWDAAANTPTPWVVLFAVIAVAVLSAYAAAVVKALRAR